MMVSIQKIGNREFLLVGSDSRVMIPVDSITDVHYRRLQYGSWVRIFAHNVSDPSDWYYEGSEAEAIIEFFEANHGKSPSAL